MPCKLLSCIEDAARSQLRYCPHCNDHLVLAEYTSHEKLYRDDGIWTKTYLPSKQPLDEQTLWKALESTTPIPALDVQTVPVSLQKHPRKVKSFEKIGVSGPLLAFPRAVVSQDRLSPEQPAPETTVDPANEHAFQFRYRRNDPYQQMRMKLPNIEQSNTATLSDETVSVQSELTNKRLANPGPPHYKTNEQRTVQPAAPIKRPSHPQPPPCKTPERPTVPSNAQFHSTPLYKSTPKCEEKTHVRSLFPIPKKLSFAPVRVTPNKSQPQKPNGLQIKVSSLTPTPAPKRMGKDRLKPFCIEPQRVAELKNRKPRTFSPTSKRLTPCKVERSLPQMNENLPVDYDGSIPADIDFSNISLDDDSVPVHHTAFLGEGHSECTYVYDCADNRPSISGASSPDRSPSGDESTLLYSENETSVEPNSDVISHAYSSSETMDNTSMFVNIPDSREVVSSIFSSMLPLVDSSISAIDPQRFPSIVVWTISDSEDESQSLISSLPPSTSSSDAIPRAVPSEQSSSEQTECDTELLSISDDTSLLFPKKSGQCTPFDNDTDLLNASTRDFISMPPLDDTVMSPVSVRVETDIAYDIDDTASVPALFPYSGISAVDQTEVFEQVNVSDIDTIGVHDDNETPHERQPPSIEPEQYSMPSNLSIPYMRDDTSYFDGGDRGINIDVSADESTARSRVYRVMHRYGPTIDHTSADPQPHPDHVDGSETKQAAPQYRHYTLSSNYVPVPVEPGYKMPGHSTDIDAVAAKLQSGTRADFGDMLSRVGHYDGLSTDIDGAATNLRQHDLNSDLSTDIDAVASEHVRHSDVIEYSFTTVTSVGAIEDLSTDIDAVTTATTSCAISSPIEQTVDDSTDIDAMYLEANKTASSVPAQLHNPNPFSNVSFVDGVNILADDVHGSFVDDMWGQYPNLTSEYNIESTRRETAVFESPHRSNIRDLSLSRVVEVTPDDSYRYRVWRAAVMKADNDAIKYTRTSFEFSSELNSPNATAATGHYTSAARLNVNSVGHPYRDVGQVQQPDTCIGEVTRFLRDIKESVLRRQTEVSRVQECRCGAYDEARRSILSEGRRDSVADSPNVSLRLDVRYNYYFDETDQEPRGMRLPVVIRPYGYTGGANGSRSETFQNHVQAVLDDMKAVVKPH